MSGYPHNRGPLGTRDDGGVAHSIAAARGYSPLKGASYLNADGLSAAGAADTSEQMQCLLLRYAMPVIAHRNICTCNMRCLSLHHSMSSIRNIQCLLLPGSISVIAMCNACYCLCQYLLLQHAMFVIAHRNTCHYMLQ